MVGDGVVHSPEWGSLRIVASVVDAIGDGGGREEDDSPGPDVRALLEGWALLTLLRGTGDGARGPIRV